MRLLVTGGTGFIGQPLCRTLSEQGHVLTVLTRAASAAGHVSNRVRAVQWEPGRGGEWERAVAEADAVINLAGEPIAAHRWRVAQKQHIVSSRMETTRALVAAMRRASPKPALLINASAIGYYGPHGDEPLTEEAASGAGFLAETCRQWEAEAMAAESLGMRVVRLRIGIVLGQGGGALSKMTPPFRAFVGGPLGTGRQWMSWIHREDVIGLIAWLLTQPQASGAFNATAPEPATMRQFCQALGRTLQRPSWAPVPSFLLRVLLGEMAEMLLTGQRVLPARAQSLGYRFRYPTLQASLSACV